MWVDNQGIRTKLFDKEILFEFANPTVSITPFNQEINLVGLDIPSKLIGNQFMHNDILSISLCISKFQIGILNQEFLLKIIFFKDFGKIKYITFKYDIILKSKFQSYFIKGDYFNLPSHMALIP